MEYIIKGFCGGTLGEPPQTQHAFDETAIKQSSINTFNNCDYTGTITIKGAHKVRSLENNFSAQYLLFIKIKDIIQSYCQYYIINYEAHKCAEWLHSHFVFRPFHRSKVPRMRQEIYHLIEGHKLQRKTYKHRILIEKPYNYLNYIDYIFKDFEDMAYYNIQPHYKLISQSLYTECPDLTKNTLTKEENLENKTPSSLKK